MKHRILNMTGTLIAARHSHRLFTLRLSRLRKVISEVLIVTLVLVPLLHARTMFTPPVMAQVISCGGATRIFQGCPLGGPFEVSLENQALDDLLDLHQLPTADRSRLLGWERDELRALLYDKLLGVIKKAPRARTPDEQAALDAFAARVKQKRVDAAQYAVDEYNLWSNSPCTYTPPPGFTYSGVAQCAGARLNPNAAVDPPKFEEFQAYGVARAYAQLQDLKNQRLMNQVVHGVTFLSGLAAGGIAGAVVAVNVPQAVIRVIFPFAGRAFPIGSVTAGTGAASAAIGGAVLIVIAAIVIGALRGVDVFNDVAIPGKLQAKLDEVKAADAPDLAQLITTDAGKQEFFSIFTLLTLPDFPATGPVPAPQSSDPQFLLRQDGSATTTTSPTINFKSWDNDNQSARLNGSWFINKYNEDNVDKERWALKINYINWQGERWTAGRAGATFLHTKDDGSGKSFSSGEIKYKDWSGNNFTASLLLASLSIAPLSVVLDRGHQEPGVDVIAAQTLPVALVNSGGQAPNTLSVEVNNAASATVTGVTLSDLSIDSNGRVTASLKAECTAIAPTFTLKVTDNVGQSKTALLAIQLSPLADKPYNPLESGLPDGAVGNPYSGLVIAIYILAGFCNASDLHLTLISGELPPGLSVGPIASGIFTIGYGVSGTPTCGGSYTFTVRNSFSNGDSFDRTYTVYIDSPSVALPSGAVSWWSGEHGLNDDLKQNNLSQVGAFGSTSFAPGKVGLAFSFDGNGAVRLPGNFFPFNSAGNPSFTFETWFKTSESGVIIGQYVNGNPPTANTPGIYVGTDGKLHVQMFKDATGSINLISSPSAVNDDFFHHVAVIYDGTQEIVYLDGSQMGINSNVQATSTGNFVYHLGMGYTQGWLWTNSTFFYFNGLIDEPTLYNRSLSAEEVQSIFAAGSAGKIDINPTIFNSTCPGANTGVVKLNVLGGMPPLTYAMDDDSFQPEGVFYGLAAGNHTLKVKDTRGHILTQSVNIDDPPALTMSATTTSPTCAGTSGSITITASGGTGTLMYSINNGQSFQAGNLFSNLSPGTYQVVVKDANSCAAAAQSVTLNSPPVSRSKNVTVAAGTNCTADASIDDSSYDPDSGDTITLTQSPAGPYPLGSTTVTLTATDSHGVSCSSTATVTVVDQGAPTLTLKPAISLWQPNHAYQTVTMSQMVASVSDCSSNLGIGNVVIEKVTSDEPDDAPGNSDGITTNDIVIAADCKSVQLRAERNETLNGRVYVITLRVKDAAGNTTRKDFKVSVPIGRNDVAVQDATALTKTSLCSN